MRYLYATLLTIGEKVRFSQSKRKKEMHLGVIQSMAKNQITILACIIKHLNPSNENNDLSPRDANNFKLKN